MEALSNKQKDIIRENLRAYVAKYPSQNKAAGSLKSRYQRRYVPQYRLTDRRWEK